jgi:hypothetical protein
MVDRLAWATRLVVARIFLKKFSETSTTKMTIRP